mgnify:FL=1
MGSGGHTAQMLRLEKLLGDRYDYEYLANANDEVTPKKVKGRLHLLDNPRMYRAPWLSIVQKTIGAFTRSIALLRRFDVVISAGPGLTIPVFYAAKLMGRKTIFLESWCRAHSMSVSGKACYPIADLFFVQWPEMTKHYPRAIYVGRLG